MPDREVQTIRHQIYYQYAKIIARRAFSSTDGIQAKGKHYGFIKQTLRKLKSGEMSWSDITREDWQLVEAEKKCIYCASDTPGNKRTGLYEPVLLRSPWGATSILVNGDYSIKIMISATSTAVIMSQNRIR